MDEGFQYEGYWWLPGAGDNSGYPASCDSTPMNGRLWI